MTSSGAAQLLRKEFRTLLPIWGACVVTIAAAAVHRSWLGLAPGATRYGLEGLAILAYGLGSIAIGAHIVGGEYAWRTLPALLTVPASRSRVLLAKFGALACLLAAFVLLAPAPWVRHEPDINAILRLGPLYGFCVAPFLTMICRGTLAGTVFTAAIAPMLFLVGRIVGSSTYGSDSAAEIDRFTYALLVYGSVLLCAGGVMLTARAFLRLEAVEGRGVDLSVPDWIHGRRRAARRSSLRLLVGKELRLQQMSFVVAALYAAAWATALALKSTYAELDVPPLGAGAALYFSLVAVLIGSLVSAEERQFGTSEWQALVPMASSRQWFIKIAVAFGLALAFLASAIVFARFLPSLGAGPSGRALVPVAAGIVLWTSVGIYASSLSTSGVRALALALVLVAAITFIVPLIGSVEWRTIHVLTARQWPDYASMAFTRPFPSSAITQALIAGLCMLLLWLAFTNHRSAKTSAARVWRQSAVLVAYVAGALMINGLAVLA